MKTNKILNQKDFKRELHFACVCFSQVKSFEHGKKVQDSHDALVEKVKRLEAEMNFKMVDYECPKCGHVAEDFEGEAVQCCRCESNEEIVLEVTAPNMEQIFSPKNNSQRARVNDK